MHFTVEAQKLVRAHLKPGDIAVDATAGNGFDTLFLADQVQSHGCIYVFDIQSESIDIVRAKLVQANLAGRAKLICCCHSEMSERIELEHHGRVQAVMLNLGYRPFGDKSITTRSNSTLSALDAARDILAPAGVISLLAYRGHDGGGEADSVRNWVESQRNAFEIDEFCDRDNPKSPSLWLLKSNGCTQRRIAR